MRLAALISMVAAAAAAQTPLAKPLAQFDKMVEQLSSARVVGDPVTAGATTVVPFAAVQFSLGSAAAPIAAGGGMGGKVVPLGVLIVEGDDVRLESIPEQPEQPGLLRQLVQALLEKKLVFMGNGVNLGSVPGTVQDLGPIVNGLLGGTTIVGNGLNLGNLSAPKPAAPATQTRAEPAPRPKRSN